MKVLLYRWRYCDANGVYWVSEDKYSRRYMNLLHPFAEPLLDTEEVKEI